MFVLLPPGDFLMGAQNEDPDKPNYNARSGHGEWPVHRVRFTRPPVFLAKYENGAWSYHSRSDLGLARVGGKVVSRDTRAREAVPAQGTME